MYDKEEKVENDKNGQQKRGTSMRYKVEGILTFIQKVLFST